MPESADTGNLFWLGIDDTDSPDGMCTTWLGSLLIRRLRISGCRVDEARLIRLNPTIPFKTRGNAAIAIRCRGDPFHAFDLACRLVKRYADMDAENTHPGIVVTDHQPPASFYHTAVTSVCTITEAKDLLREHALAWKGFRLGRGLIGATAAVSSRLPDVTWEYLAYREAGRTGTVRFVDQESLFTAEELTSPHTWDSVDPYRRRVVCVPHTPDPILFGIRGESPFAIMRAVSCVRSEPYAWGQIWLTNQGTDAHLLEGRIGSLRDGHSYRVPGTVVSDPVTGPGGHVSLRIRDQETVLTCMAFEPTKQFRNVVRSLIPGDRILAVGSFLNERLNLEKILLFPREEEQRLQAPLCPACLKRMTSAGSGKGYKCRKCRRRSVDPERVVVPRIIRPGWYEVPPVARRHLSRPLIRGPGYPAGNRKGKYTAW